MKTPTQSIKSKRVFITVFFKERDEYRNISFRAFDRYLHAGLITHTNNYGWFCR